MKAYSIYEHTILRQPYWLSKDQQGQYHQ